MGRLAVHPRAGGERVSIPKPALSASGSSPRGRGTPLVVCTPTLFGRFIPRGRGTHARHAGRQPGHRFIPRAGGERDPTADQDAARYAFIPARAGNAAMTHSSAAVTAVHPRAGGERFATAVSITAKSGSSPRGRGTPEKRARGVAGVRFIPARAGNAAPSCSENRIMTVHPRRGAGNAPGRSTRRSPWSVHPRAGGERFLSYRRIPPSSGSSPRGRGTPQSSIGTRGARRFIPARAGNA